MSEIFSFCVWELEMAKPRESYAECVGIESYGKTVINIPDLVD